MIGKDSSEDESPQKIKDINPIDLSRKKKVKRPEDEDIRNK